MLNNATDAQVMVMIDQFSFSSIIFLFSCWRNYRVLKLHQLNKSIRRLKSIYKVKWSRDSLNNREWIPNFRNCKRKTNDRRLNQRFHRFRCLAEHNWNYDKAAEVFLELKNQVRHDFNENSTCFIIIIRLFRIKFQHTPSSRLNSSKFNEKQQKSFCSRSLWKNKLFN